MSTLLSLSLLLWLLSTVTVTVASTSTSISTSTSSSTSSTSHHAHTLATTDSSNIPSARYSIPLTYAMIWGRSGAPNRTDSLHFVMTVYLGSKNVPVYFVADTGSSVLLIRDLNGTSSCRPVGECYSLKGSDTGKASTVFAYQGREYDGEIWQDISRSMLITERMRLRVWARGVPDAYEESQTHTSAQFSRDLQKAVSSPPNIRTDDDRFRICSQCSLCCHWYPEAFRRYEANDGIMGLGYRPTPVRLSDGSLSFVAASPFLELITPFSQDQSASPILAFDLNNQSASELHVGGIDDTYRDRMIWATNINQAKLKHSFNIYSMRMCNIDLLSRLKLPTAGALSAEIVTGQTCLSVPYEIFSLIVSNLPSSCIIKPATVIVCELLKNVTFHLPTLELTVSRGGKAVYIPMDQLLIDYYPSPWPTRLCLTSTGPYTSTSTSFPITLGNKALFNLYTVLRMDTGEIGFANKNVVNASMSQCYRSLRCIGMQTRDPFSNVCVDPPCEEYNFGSGIGLFVFDAEAKVCRMSSHIHALLSIVAIAWLFTEVVWNEAVLWITAYVGKTLQPGR